MLVLLYSSKWGEKEKTSSVIDEVFSLIRSECFKKFIAVHVHKP